MLKYVKQSGMPIAKNLMFHAHTKHKEIQYLYVSELIEDGTMQMVYCPNKAKWSGHLHQGTWEGSASSSSSKTWDCAKHVVHLQVGI